MALMKDGLWGTEVALAQTGKYRTFVTQWDKVLVIIVLSVNQGYRDTVWKKLADQFHKKTWSNKLAQQRRLNHLRLQEGE